MARIVKTQKRRIHFEGFAFIMFATAVILTIFSNLFLRSSNASLMIQIQDMNRQCDILRTDNQRLTIEIQSLQNRDRIFTIAENAGLTQINDNIISVNGD
ncbi:MAG: hypothetical protein IIV88_02990 [Erysipelotrichaceae bacterium]|nr:hypothetical protein [Erysipelotrichaceae bacterium]MBQ1810450.1 hypothetical protein [Erysipelotrichaceae bacterium]MBQ5756205.1 hypothetical protein [Erysipelotrichaceae bacterium]MBR3150511.1 hypothetical protein [Erysipelotrichaceae bacterium]MBR3167615.1 hypothetical protein [Erysipelotrichaceae bacterium]